MKNIYTFILFLLFTFGLSSTAKAQLVAPDFSLEDINGEVHNLYADYLDQGKTVFIIFGVAWSPFDELWMETGVMQEFHNLYAEAGEAVFLFIEADEFTTLDDLYGTGPNSNSGYDMIGDNPFPIINAPSNQIWEDFDITYFPTSRLICPDGSVTTDDLGGQLENGDERLVYANLVSSDHVVDFMIDICGTAFEVDQCEAHVYQDLNDNCEDDAEARVPFVTAEISGPNGDFVRISDDNGEFRFLATSGEYTVDIVAPNELWEACDGNQTATFTGTNETVNLDFGLQPVEDCLSPVAAISSNLLRRCFDSNIYVDYCNEGTVPTEGTVIEVTLDEFLEYVSSNVTPDQIDGQTLYFNIGDLDVWECGKIKITVLPDCEIELGTEQCYSVNIYPTDPCSNDSYGLQYECQEVIGSYDPNDKRAFPLSGSDEYRIKSNTPIHYQIRFQNVGTDTAFTVVIDDVISENLDLSTLRPGVASHDVDVEILEDRLVKFTFNDINLVDSTTNELGSNGFVNYTIEQIQDLVDGDVIENQGAIFFDFNDPVITNVTTHIIDNAIVNVEDDILALEVMISPNPVNEIMQVSILSEWSKEHKLSIFSGQGQLIHSENLLAETNEINVSALAQGLYILKLEDLETGIKYSQKFTKL